MDARLWVSYFDIHRRDNCRHSDKNKTILISPRHSHVTYKLKIAVTLISTQHEDITSDIDLGIRRF
jgi:hypothetical protein